MDPSPLPGRREGNHFRGDAEKQETAGDEPHPRLQLPFLANQPLPSSPSSSSSSVRQSIEEGGVAAGGSSGVSFDFVEKEHMFDKTVTPSDVGKLNRLVIPKQHAEKYFPLDAASGEKGLLLSFEDRTGKHWRFRYSYWNSSQSYVMTKGWSRFVKEKRLGAGDTVSFGRGVGEGGRRRFFIDWNHRPDALSFPYPLIHRLPLPFHNVSPSSSVMVPFAHPGAVPWGRLVMPPLSPSFSAAAYDHLQYGIDNPNLIPSNPYICQRSTGNPSQGAVQHLGGRSAGEQGTFAMPMAAISSSVPSTQSSARTGKTMRLFGVNLGCSPSGEDVGNAAAVRGQASSLVLPSPRTRPGESSVDTDQHPMDLAL